MNLKIVAIGDKAPAWVRSGFDEYAKRMPRDMMISLVEIAASKHHGASSRGLAAEGERMLARLDSRDWVVSLDVQGKSLSSEQLAGKLEDWRMRGTDVSLTIGGADGLAPQVQARANESISLSALTLPHYLARLVLAESLYRAWSITAGHPYHRA